MAHCFVEFGAYGAIGDFDIEGMTEKEILENVEEIIQEFTAQEAGYIIVNNKEDYQ